MYVSSQCRREQEKKTFFKNNLTDLIPLNSSAFFSSYAQF